MNVIELRNIRYRWHGQAMDTIAIEQLALKKGEHVFIRGASGSGKTTLLNVLAGILVPSHGDLNVLGSCLNQLKQSARDRFRADHMGIIFQQFNLLPYLSVLDNVTLPCQFSARRKAQAGDVQATALHLLDRLGLDKSLQQRSVMELSVGQQQRVSVARALIGKPELIIADEPTSALDTDTRNEFLNLLFQEAEEQKSTVIFVSHDPHIAKSFPRIIDLHRINTASQKVSL